MKTKKSFLTGSIYIFLTMFGINVTAQNAIPLTFDYIPLREFKGDTTNFIKTNFRNTMRYDEKKFEFFFNEFEKDIPIRSVIFRPAAGKNAIGYIYFFIQTKEEAIKEMKEKGEVYGLMTFVNGSFNERQDPEGYSTIKKLGIGDIIDMNRQIRTILKNKTMAGITYSPKFILEKYK